MSDNPDDTTEGLTLFETPTGRMWRDDKGVIRKRELTSDQASKMAHISKERRPTVEALLREFGYDDPDNTPEYARILAKVAAKETGYSRSALEGLAKLSPVRLDGQDSAGNKWVKPAPGQCCALCGQVNINDLISRDVLVELAGILAGQPSSEFGPYETETETEGESAGETPMPA